MNIGVTRNCLFIFPIGPNVVAPAVTEKRPSGLPKDFFQFAPLHVQIVHIYVRSSIDVNSGT